ncbi:MAG TPA: LysE family translocator [Phenylobacterium sp.]
MDWRVWIAFVGASLLMGLVPGPGVASIVGFAISSGRRTALASVAGMALGNAAAMTLSLAGVGAILAASALAFSILKWLGAAYLIALGLIVLAKSARGAAGLNVAARAPITPRTAFLSNLTIGVFHPKTIVFFVAFAPQFISPNGSYPLQAAMLIATFTAVVGLTDATYAVLASRAANLLRRPVMQRWFSRAGGGTLILAGVATAAAQK